MFKASLLTKIATIMMLGSLAYISSASAKVVSSIKPLGFIVEAIADGVTETEVLLPDGASPHSYALKPSDLIKLKSADLIVWVGDDLETFLPTVLKNVDSNKQISLAENNQIKALLRAGHEHHHDEEDEEEHEHHHDHDHDHHGEYDMHIWLSPQIAQITAKAIHDNLKQIYPDKSELIDNNLKKFNKDIQNTRQIIAKKLDKVENKGYFVFHEAYGYFESEFGLNNLGSFTINPSVQPGLKTVYDIQQKLKTENAVCIFSEPQFSPEIVTKLVKGTGVKTGQLDPLGVDVQISNNAYSQFLLNLTQQFLNCLE